MIWKSLNEGKKQPRSKYSDLGKAHAYIQMFLTGGAVIVALRRKIIMLLS